MPACLHSNPKDVGQYRLTQEEQRVCFAIMYKLSPTIKLMGKQVRQEFIKISEVLDAFKKDEISETEVIYEFINLSLGELKNRDKLLALISLDERALKVNAWWAIIRNWAKVPAINSFLLSRNPQHQEELNEAAYDAWLKLANADAEKRDRNNKAKWEAMLRHVREKGTELSMEGMTEEESMQYFDAMDAYLKAQKNKQAYKLADKPETEEGRPIFTFDML